MPPPMVPPSGDDGTKLKVLIQASGKTDEELEIASTVLRTLQMVAQGSPVTVLREAAKVSVNILTLVSKLKEDREEFGRLATDAAMLIFVLYCKHRNVQEDAPRGLKYDPNRTLQVLLEIEKSVQNDGLTHNLSARGRHGMGGKMQEHQQQLQNCLAQSGFQTGLDLQTAVRRLIGQRGRALEGEDEARPNRGSSGPPGSFPGLDTITSFGQDESGSDARATTGETNAISTGVVFSAPNDAATTSTSNSMRNTEMDAPTSNTDINQERHIGDSHDNSVHIESGVSFDGAYGFNFGGSPTVHWNINRPS